MIKTIKTAVKKTVASFFGIGDEEVGSLFHRRAFVAERTAEDRVRSLIRKLAPVVEERKELIRLGPKGDGGYLVPNDLEGITACFSPGVALISGFEKDCADRGMQVFMADKSVDGPTDTHERFNFKKKFVGAFTDEDHLTIDRWVASSLPQDASELMLQIDIEGAEYETFLSVSDSLMQRFRIIAAEFHGLHQLWNSGFFPLASRTFEKILHTHHCVHIHPNNCGGSTQKGDIEIPRVTEFTFIRKDRLKNPSPATKFPNPLDCNNTANPTLPLAECWYSHRQ